MQQVVCKFGGTSVSSRENWDYILHIVQQHLKAGKQPIIVCSALSQASNQLEAMIKTALLHEPTTQLNALKKSYLQLAHALDVDSELLTNDWLQLEQWLTGIALLKEAPAKTQAQILSLGELMLSRLGHAFLNQHGVACSWFDARLALKADVSVNKQPVPYYLAARVNYTTNTALADQLASHYPKAILTQGFIAATPEGETVLLGRGGSDTSAALFAAMIKAESCEIWTDVPGIYTANPRQLPHARLLKQLNYDEAQEIASMGAKVLHPNCIPPVRQAGIPMMVKYTSMPAHNGTTISTQTDIHAPRIKSIQVKTNISLISIDALSMWQQVGFLADVFTTFKQHGFSVDLLSSSEFNVTVSLDTQATGQNRRALEYLLNDLNQFGRTRLIEPCSAVSLVGQGIRGVLPQLGPALALFDAQQVYLMSLASNDLNLTFVVAESQADKLCQKLHQLLIEHNPQHFYYSKSWQEEFGAPAIPTLVWWEKAKDKLLVIANKKAPCYVYDKATALEKVAALQALSAINKIFYAIKANPYPGILKALYHKGLNFECVSKEELKHVLRVFPKIDPKRLLFTPNFCAYEEYAYAVELGCYLTIDNLYPFTHWPELFRQQSVIVRVDPGAGKGHHKYVCTGGNESKFGIPKEQLAEVAQLASTHDIKIIGLHAHAGSGILSTELWQETALMLAVEAKQFPDVRLLNLGGGLGVVEKPYQQPLNLHALNDLLNAVKSRYPHLDFWLEPGRFVVAESGVILARVTQRKQKGSVNFIGIETGMNTLLRPALYGAYHEIVNLTRLQEDKTMVAHVVGPICESGDTLGYDRFLPETKEGDVVLIATAGAYGHCMSSSYNLRPPAEEMMLDEYAEG